MRCITIGPNEAGQRLDKFLHKYMKEAPAGFFYKMMRKKNIVLNGCKCTGGEKLQAGDELKFFMAEETLAKFGAAAVQRCDTAEYDRAFSAFGPLRIVYEDAHILAVNKPAGILSQKSKPADLSLNEWLIGYLLHGGQTDAAQLCTFHPSVCNRLDRNTSGLVLCGKSLEGTRFLTELIRERGIRKFYRLMIMGTLLQDGELTAWLKKDEKSNQVQVLSHNAAGAQPIKTGLHSLSVGTLPGGLGFTCAEVELFTGKTHQIRAHLSSIGHPLLGDPKYGDAKANEICKRLGVRSQMLCACRVEFPDTLPDHFKSLEGMTLHAALPEEFERISRYLKGQSGNDLPHI